MTFLCYNITATENDMYTLFVVWSLIWWRCHVGWWPSTQNILEWSCRSEKGHDGTLCGRGPFHSNTNTIKRATSNDLIPHSWWPHSLSSSSFSHPLSLPFFLKQCNQGKKSNSHRKSYHIFLHAEVKMNRWINYIFSVKTKRTVACAIFLQKKYLRVMSLSCFF